MTIDTDTPQKRRLNPFAFPSETNTRFTLLMVAPVMLAFSLFLTVGVDLSSLVTPTLPKNPTDTAAFEKALSQMQYNLGLYLKLMAVPTAIMIVLLILAGAVYWGHARRIRHSKNLHSLTRNDDAPFVDALESMVSLSGISPAPSIEIDKASRSVDGQAFGFRNHYAVRLGGGLRLLLRQNADSFRAIILHELAHIANADVASTYFAQAIWSVFLILLVVPATIFIAFSFIQGLAEKIQGGLTNAEWLRIFTLNVPTVLIVLFQFAGTLAIVAAIRASLLRTREIYADWRASLWGAEAGLSHILGHGKYAGENKTSKWTRLWQLHPTNLERLTMLENPINLFQVANELPFFVGALLGYALHGASNVSLVLGGVLSMIQGIIMLQFPLIFGWDHPLVTPDVLYLVTSTLSASIIVLTLALGFWIIYLVAGALGLAVLRESIADLTTGRGSWFTYPKLWKPAAWVAIGFQISSMLTPGGYFGLLPELINMRGLTVLFFIIFLTVVTAFLTWLGLVYIRFFARRILGSHARQQAPQNSRRLLTLILSGLMLASFLPAVFGELIILDIVHGDVPTMLWVQALGGSIAVAVFQYVVVFGATWIFMQSIRLFRKPHCPSCNQITKKQYAVGQLCEHCGQELAPWLFVKQSPLQVQAI